ncbi:MAG: BMP family ABC transporter substrate-binding protein [Actinobacteria bacterium]|nr:BMP family ABC transporter substrate-binding protein [Actinomycetota bacterium]
MTKRNLALAAILLVIAAASVVLALGTSPGSAKSDAAFKAAWIYVGPHNDGGWSQAHDQGRIAVQTALGSKVQTTYKENVPEGPQVAQVIDSLIRDGNKIIFATSFGYQPAMVAAAKKNPDVKFEMATGYLSSKNMADYYGAGEDAIYLSGIAAGAASKTGTVGYVVPFAIPEVIRHTNAFALGVQKAHPGAKVKIIWTNSWFDPAKETKAAENLHSAGADVIGQNVDSPAAGQYSEKNSVPWVGYDSNAQKFAPKSWLTGAVYNWGPYYTKRVTAAMNGTWKTGNYYGNLKDGFTKLAPFGKGVSAKTKALIASQEAKIKSGKWNEFSGPIYDQSGKLRIKPGHRASFGDLMSMNYLVKGVIGSPKG